MTASGRGPVAIRAEGWGWRHAARREWAVRALDLHIEPGERVLLLGPSGSGKSTLLRGLAGILGDQDEGEREGVLTVGGVDALQARGSVGLLLQDPDSHLVLSRVGDDVAFGCENLGMQRDEIWRRVPEALAAVGLDVPLERSTAELSGGQKQRAALAGILAMGPGLILLDEPTANLDPAGVQLVVDTMSRVAAGRDQTIVVVEHHVDPWLDLVDRVVVLTSDGGVLADGAPDDVLDGHRDTLIRHGVWVPGWHASAPSRPTTGGDVLLTAADLAVGHGRHRIVADHIDLTVRAGRALAITGPNGAGKSTLALAVGGLAPPRAGAVVASPLLADGIGTVPSRWRSRQLLTRIGSVFQDPEHQFLTGRVRAELEVGPALLRRSRTPALGDHEPVDLDELLVRLRLDTLADANPFTLSGGQKRRLSVATALATGPRVLVLDEPTFGQDLRTWTEMLQLLSDQRRRGSALVAISHDVQFVEALADDVLELAPAVEQAA